MSDNLKSWAFRRPYCTPGGGFVLARTAKEAFGLIAFAYGPCSGTVVKCVATGTVWDEDSLNAATKQYDDDMRKYGRQERE